MPTLPSGLPDFVGDDEDLARFLTQSNHFNAIMAKPAVFLPCEKDRETSISRHGMHPLDRLWKLGSEAAKTRTLYGAALFKASNIRSIQLEVIADEPPDRHAAIRGWPWIENDPDLQKAKQKELAARIASAAGTPLMR